MSRASKTTEPCLSLMLTKPIHTSTKPNFTVGPSHCHVKVPQFPSHPTQTQLGSQPLWSAKDSSPPSAQTPLPAPLPALLTSSTKPPDKRTSSTCPNSDRLVKGTSQSRFRGQESILEEVLSWRRTCFQSPQKRLPIEERHKRLSCVKSDRSRPFLLTVFLTFLMVVPTVLASESPDRECCDNPLYKFDPPPGRTTFRPPLLTYGVPEVADYPEYPDQGLRPGILSTTPAAGSMECLLARTLCTEDSACNQILQIIPRVCGLELVTCSTPTVTKCQAALRTLQSFPFFNPVCLCKASPPDPDCNQFKDFLLDHPCLNAKYKALDPFPVDALATCDHANDVCNNDISCSRRVKSFTENCPIRRNLCVMTDVPACHSSWQNLRQSPVFGCFCPSNMPNKASCDRVFNVVNANDCIDAQLPDTLRVKYTNQARAAKFWNMWYQNLVGGWGGPPHRTTRHTVSVDETSTPYNLPTTVDRFIGGDHGTSLSQKDQEVVNLRSTCHLAMDKCERDSSCRPYLEQVKSKCVENCNRERCMAAVKEFYRRIPSDTSLDIAFCLCKTFHLNISSGLLSERLIAQKNGGDEQCFRAQVVLHPVCAQTPSNWNGRDEDQLPSCHSLARDCRANKSCRMRLERYEQSCSVDSDTKTCAGTYSSCREAMVEILGTDLRTKCACTGSATAGDFRELFECIEYKRLFWQNPCIVDAQKSYHLKGGSLSSQTPEWSVATPRTRPPTPRRPSPPPVRTRPPQPKSSTKPREVKPPVTEEIPTTTTSTTTTTTTTTSTTRITTRSTEGPTPSTTTRKWTGNIGTTPWTPHTRPPRTTRQTKRPRPTTKRGSKKNNNRGKSSPGTPTTTSTTLPPKYCNLYKTEYQDENVKWIRQGFEKRLYPEGKEGSHLCGCKAGAEIKCTTLAPIPKKPCNTKTAFYSHASPFYLAYRGQCLCYSGQFICAKHDKTTGKKDKKLQVAENPVGVFLYLGYSKKDLHHLTLGRMKIQDEKNVPSTDEEEEQEVKNTIQQTVNHFTQNTNKSDCRMNLVSRVGENYILKATLDEFDLYRDKKNMSDAMLYKEKVECFSALQSIAQKVNDRDPDMRSHIVLSMFKVAAAEANVPEPPPDSDSRLISSINIIIFSCFIIKLLQ